eukprot:COSAG05_NODE_11964_length_488_cov_102.120823_2_plen_134_part_00
MVLHEYSVEQTTGTHLRAQHLGETRLLRRIDLRILYCNSLSLSLSPLSLCLCLSVSLSVSLVRLALVLGGGAQLTVRVGNEKYIKYSNTISIYFVHPLCCRQACSCCRAPRIYIQLRCFRLVPPCVTARSGFS